MLLAGERRGYNANQIYRDPAWRRVDPDGAMRMHPSDARARGLDDGARAICSSDTGEVEVTIEVDQALRPGMVTLPHGYGMRYAGGDAVGPQINRLTASEHCDRWRGRRTKSTCRSAYARRSPLRPARPDIPRPGLGHHDPAVGRQAAETTGGPGRTSDMRRASTVARPS
ncbi:MAG: molybdopterin dinucleotide binding domain-containing protein [Polyangiaceae bacterium]